LIARSPSYAEAYNQRAILYWRWGDYNKSITDCEQTLKLNPHHFGALAGLAQCHLHLKRPADALKVFKLANRVNPAMTGVEDNIHALEQMLREERKRKR
jgi:tetratricopeptide (TPR) repeat protein